MSNMSLCQHNKCIQKDICQRFTTIYDPTGIKFYNLCDQKNDYYWFYGDRSKLVVVDLIEKVKINDINIEKEDDLDSKEKNS